MTLLKLGTSPNTRGIISLQAIFLLYIIINEVIASMDLVVILC